MAPTRRRVLSLTAGALTALSGCLFGDTHDDSELAIHFEPVATAEVGAESLIPSEKWSAVQRTFLEGGVPNSTTAYGHRPFDSGEAIRSNGTYYAVSVVENGTERNGTETVTRPVLRAEPVSDVAGEVGGFASVPRADALALRCAIVSARREGPEPCVLHAGDRSAFWPELDFEYVERGDEFYRLAAAEEAVGLARYDYDFEPVAQNRSTFAEYATSELLAIDYDDRSLSPDERSIFATAAAEGVYRESPPYSDELRSLVEGFERRTNHGRAYVRFGGSYYLAWTTQFFDD